MGLSLLLAFALLLFSAAHAYHHPGDSAAEPSKPAAPIWNAVGLLLLAGIAYAIWKVYSYQKKFRA